MNPLKVAIATVGCRANQADSATLVRNLDRRLVRLVDGFKNVDIAIIMSCCVTAEAERDCRKLARRALSLSPNSRVIITGCAVNAFSDFTEKIHPKIEKWTTLKSDIGDLARFINRQAAPDHIPDPSFGLRESSLGRTRLLLKIQSGCSHGCSYCIVPRARGKERSMPRDEVLTNMDRLAAEGALEVVLTGVQLGAWGKDLSKELHLADLILEAVSRLFPGRLRLSSLEPWSVDEKLLQTIAEHERICPHLHLPLQSGDDRILAKMKRGYNSEEFLKLVETARRLMPEVAIGTDVVVGFPGEDKSAHENTIETLKELRPAYVHAFSYSPRPGTRAEKMPDRPAKEIVRARVAEIRDFAAQTARRFRNGEIGKVRELLVEQRVPDGVKGMTETFVPTIVHDGSLKPGGLVKIKITDLDKEERLIAEVIK